MVYEYNLSHPPVTQDQIDQIVNPSCPATPLKAGQPLPAIPQVNYPFNQQYLTNPQ